MWKQKWRKKAEWFGGGGGSGTRSSDVCFKCGAMGHWASECRGLGKLGLAKPGLAEAGVSFVLFLPPYGFSMQRVGSGGSDEAVDLSGVLLVEANSVPLPEDHGGADDEEDLPLPTLEEVARRTNSICRDLPGEAPAVWGIYRFEFERFWDLKVQI